MNMCMCVNKHPQPRWEGGLKHSGAFWGFLSTFLIVTQSYNFYMWSPPLTGNPSWKDLPIFLANREYSSKIVNSTVCHTIATWQCVRLIFDNFQMASFWTVEEWKWNLKTLESCQKDVEKLSKINQKLCKVAIVPQSTVKNCTCFSSNVSINRT